MEALGLFGQSPAALDVVVDGPPQACLPLNKHAYGAVPIAVAVRRVWAIARHDSPVKFDAEQRVPREFIHAGTHMVVYDAPHHFSVAFVPEAEHVGQVLQQFVPACSVDQLFEPFPLPAVEGEQI